MEDASGEIMSSEADSTPRDDIGNETNSKHDFSNSLSTLKKEIQILSEDSHQLLTEKLFLENEISQLKKRANRLEDEIRSLRAPPHIIGFVQDIVGDKAVVRSSNGTVFLVSKNPRIETSLLKPGARVTLNQDTLGIISLLDDAYDPLVAGSEIIEKPVIEYSDIGGLKEQIKQVREAIELPFESPEKFIDFGITPPKGVLLTGPPGTGKTMLAKAVANATNATFLGLVGSELAQKYIGEGGRMVRELFDLARSKAPAIIFIDEIDAIGSKRLDSATSGDREVQRTLMQLLAELDGFDPLDQVKIIAATNRPELLDKALLRPGRFDRIIEIPMPDVDSRISILHSLTKKMPLDSEVKIEKVALMTDGFSGAELKSVTIEAGMRAISDGRDSCNNADFKSTISDLEQKRRETSYIDPDRSYS